MGFYRGPKIVTNGLVLYLDAANKKSYPGTGTTWTDLSGLGNNGTLTNGPTFNSANGGSIVFDGVDDYVSVANNSSLNASTQTVSVWYYAQTISLSRSATILGKHDTAGSYNGYNFFSTNYFDIKGSTGSAVMLGAGTYKAQTWFNLVLTFTIGGSMTGYLIGLQFGPTSIPSFTMSTNVLTIGRSLDTF